MSLSNCRLREAWDYGIKGKMQPSILVAPIYSSIGLCTGDHREVHASAAVVDSMVFTEKPRVVLRMVEVKICT